jgi:hypothetical protein
VAAKHRWACSRSGNARAMLCRETSHRGGRVIAPVWRDRERRPGDASGAGRPPCGDSGAAAADSTVSWRSSKRAHGLTWVRRPASEASRRGGCLLITLTDRRTLRLPNLRASASAASHSLVTPPPLATNPAIVLSPNQVSLRRSVTGPRLGSRPCWAPARRLRVRWVKTPGEPAHAGRGDRETEAETSADESPASSPEAASPRRAPGERRCGTSRLRPWLQAGRSAATLLQRCTETISIPSEVLAAPPVRRPLVPVSCVPRPCVVLDEVAALRTPGRGRAASANACSLREGVRQRLRERQRLTSRRQWKGPSATLREREIGTPSIRMQVELPFLAARITDRQGGSTLDRAGRVVVAASLRLRSQVVTSRACDTEPAPAGALTAPTAGPVRQSARLMGQIADGPLAVQDAGLLVDHQGRPARSSHLPPGTSIGRSYLMPTLRPIPAPRTGSHASRGWSPPPTFSGVEARLHGTEGGTPFTLWDAGAYPPSC